MVLAVHQGDVWKIVNFSIYRLTLMLVYTCSTLYHGVQGELKAIFAKLDHQSIYLFIAGTYTLLPWLPFAVSGAGPYHRCLGFSNPGRYAEHCPGRGRECCQW